MKIKLVLLFFICCQLAVAQDAKTILDKVSGAYDDGGYELTFTLNTIDNPAKITYTHDGKAYLRGNKFKIIVPDGTTWFDGKTQWLYLEGSDEVNVSEPTGEELLNISPIAMLNMYKSGFKLTYKGEKNESNKDLILIEMLPQQSKSDIQSIELKVDKQNNHLAEIIIKGKDKIDNHQIKHKTLKAQGLTDSYFVFDKRDYPDIEIIDLR